MRLAKFLLLGFVPSVWGSASPIPLQSTEQRPAVEDWDNAEAKAEAFIRQLNLTEKVSMVTGTLLDVGTGCIGRIRPIERLGFDGLCLLDGPNAVNRAHLVSIFPSGITVAASWDRELMYGRGLALGREFKAKGAHVILGPTTGPLGRHPMGGRNWEGFSPDPFLSGEAVKYTIMGHQDAGVQTSSKHFIGNEQETMRSDTVMDDGVIVDAVSSNIDDRTLHELYLWPFADAVKAGTTSVMCSYNRLNNTYACEHPHLLTGILREELGFRGFVISDWFATHSTSRAANAGLDMEQPGELPPGVTTSHGGGGYYGPNLEKAVVAGNVTEDRVDEMVRRLLTPYYLLDQDRPDYPAVDPSMPYLLGMSNAGWNSPSLAGLGNPIPGRDVRENHDELIRRWGGSATVLLKNNNNILPLGEEGCGQTSIRNIGVFGNAATDPTEGLAASPDTPSEGHEYGVITIGGGAGGGRNPYIVSPLDAVKTKANDTGAMVQYISSNDVLARNDFRSVFPIPDICLVFLKTWAAETNDRTSFELSWNSTLVVNNVASFCGQHKTVVVTNSAGVNTMPWAENPNVTAILASHYSGQEAGNSIVDVLWGQTEPSGRLPYTIPKTEDDYGFPVVNLTGPDGSTERDSSKWQADFVEGQLIDYRHFDAKDLEPLYEFGFGLGYTTFEVDPQIGSVKLFENTPSALPDSNAKIAPGGNVDLWIELLSVSATIRNTGNRVGSGVVQLYMTFPGGDNMSEAPVRVLRGFEKVSLVPSESQVVEMRLRRRDLSYWDVVAQQWRIPSGDFKLAVGLSSRGLSAETAVNILK